MARPIRIEYAGALYHITSRGDRREDIYLDDGDRMDWLNVLTQTCQRFNWIVYAYCQMTNHYHLLLETIDGNLSKGMRQLNGVYTQHFNRHHDQVGHLFQGRYKAILVQKDSYLLELSRYIVLNPVRARMVKNPDQWRWSSYSETMGAIPESEWLNTNWLLRQFGRRSKAAREKYCEFVMQGKGLPSPFGATRHQLLLGDDTFVEQFQKVKTEGQLQEFSKTQKKTLVLPLAKYATKFATRNEAMARAYYTGAYTMREIAEYFGVHYMTVSRAVRRFESTES
jgi:REP element-mobilizing transposase RayT